MRTALRLLGFTLIAAFILLLATGLWLIWNYRPTGAEPWAQFRHVSDLDWNRRIRAVHRVAGDGTALTGLAFGIMVIIDSVRQRHWISVPSGVLAIFVTSLAAFSGVLIAWDELALWAVTVGRQMSGYGFLYEHQTRYILVGSSQISVDTFQRWFWVHVVILPMLLIMLIGLALRSTWRAALPSPAERDADVGDAAQWP